ncbi:hypothetical protein J2Z48_001823 [Croceifilum oryzae]|uniref:Uncharacterized protein n=1 Tax=Croceifilum oryzae TaxID=1553429 RepID=A0AAJ1TEW4_9BACL|nr:hypothetical protein [Croceifilum oryzae]
MNRKERLEISITKEGAGVWICRMKEVFQK